MKQLVNFFLNLKDKFTLKEKGVNKKKITKMHKLKQEGQGFIVALLLPYLSPLFSDVVTRELSRKLNYSILNPHLNYLKMLKEECPGPYMGQLFVLDITFV